MTNKALAPLSLVGALLVIFAYGPAAWAFDCSKASLPVDFVICSDPQVLQANQVHETAWFAARARLDDTQKKVLLTDQRQWLQQFPPTCGVAARGKRPDAISPTTQQCTVKALLARAEFLQQYDPPRAGVQPSTASAEAQPTSSNQGGGAASPTASADKMSPSQWGQFDALMQEQYKQCWSFLGSNTYGQYIPEIKVEFTPAGALASQPVLRNPASDPGLRGLAESALRAVQKCNPLKIPVQYALYYDQWKSRIVRFDPEEMATGTANAAAPSTNSDQSVAAPTAVQVAMPGLNLSEVSQLLSKDNPQQQTSTSRELSPVASPIPAHASEAQLVELDQLIDAAYRSCWNYGGGQSSAYIPEILLDFQATGALASPPILQNPPPFDADRPLAVFAMRIASNCVVKVPQRFWPFAAKYEKRVLRFDPRVMGAAFEFR